MILFAKNGSLLSIKLEYIFMCQLLGMNCNTPTDIVFSFTGFSNRAGKTGEHTDGFGIAFFEGEGVRLFVDAQPALVSPIAALIKNYPIKSKNVIAHIRKATLGQIELKNCHPFCRELWGRYWVFSHNGDLKNFHPTLHGAFHPVGQTDSEMAFCWIMQELSKAHVRMPSFDEFSNTLSELVAQVCPYGTFNFMLSNGEVLWAFCTTKLYYIIRRYPFTSAHLHDEDMAIDFSQVTTPQDQVAVIVTEPLTTDEVWTPIQPYKLITFYEGAVL